MRYVSELRGKSSLNLIFVAILLMQGIGIRDVWADAPRTPAGEVVSVSGTVFLRPDGHEAGKSLNPAKPGDVVYSGDVINSASDGKIKILFKDKTIIDLGPSALFKVDSFKANQGANREVAVNMVYGSVRAAVAQKLEGKGKFKLRTPSAVMGVRGTEFIVKSDTPADLKQVSAVIAHPELPPVSAAASGADAAKTEVTVVQGRVDVEPKLAADAPKADLKPVVLTEGTQLTTKATDVAPQATVKVDTAQMSEIRESAKVQDNTFSKAVVVDTSASGSVGGGEATKAAMASAAMSGVALSAPASVGMSGFAGTFGNNQTFQPMNVNFLQAGMLKTISVQVLAP